MFANTHQAISCGTGHSQLPDRSIRHQSAHHTLTPRVELLPAPEATYYDERKRPSCQMNRSGRAESIDDRMVSSNIAIRLFCGELKRKEVWFERANEEEVDAFAKSCMPP